MSGIGELFETWNAEHGDEPVKTKALAEPVRALLDPQARGRQFMAARLVQLAGTRAGGLVLTRHEGGGKWGTATYSAAQNTGGLGIEPDASYGLYAP
jgi:hypothetical protein